MIMLGQRWSYRRLRLLFFYLSNIDGDHICWHYQGIQKPATLAIQPQNAGSFQTCDLTYLKNYSKKP